MPAASAASPAAPQALRYRLGDAEATRRARTATLVRACTTLAPVVLAIVLLRRLGWGPGIALWAVAGALCVLVVVRAVVGYGRARRKLRSFAVTVSDEDVHVETTSDGYAIARARVARMVEVEGSLGGIRVESLPDPRTGVVYEAHVPRGGAGYAEVRARLESWGPMERRGRRGPAVRFALGALVVVGIFFVPFLLEDFVARSRVVAAGLVISMWLVMRFAMRPR
ncbi:MAG: hypothetical protein ACRELB_23530 [Polyangiaceae bacterium]